MILAVEAPLIWFAVTVGVVGAGLMLVFFARRGVMVMIWRGTYLLVAFIGIAVEMILTVYRYSPELPRNQLIFFGIVGLLLGSIYHYFNNIPYWHDTYDRNLARKINLEKATFSVVVDWARRKHISRKTYAWIWVLIAITGPALGRFLSGSSGTIAQIGPLAIAFFLFVCGIGFALSEYYYAYKVWQLERRIGRPLIIDAYVK